MPARAKGILLPVLWRYFVCTHFHRRQNSSDHLATFLTPTIWPHFLFLALLHFNTYVHALLTVIPISISTSTGLIPVATHRNTHPHTHTHTESGGTEVKHARHNDRRSVVNRWALDLSWPTSEALTHITTVRFKSPLSHNTAQDLTGQTEDIRGGVRHSLQATFQKG